MAALLRKRWTKPRRILQNVPGNVGKCPNDYVGKERPDLAAASHGRHTRRRNELWSSRNGNKDVHSGAFRHTLRNVHGNIQ
jgi:hypothetical protein